MAIAVFAKQRDWFSSSTLAALQRFGILSRQARKEQTYVLRVGVIVQLSQREMCRSVQPINIRKAENDVVDFLLTRPDAHPNPLQEADCCPKKINPCISKAITRPPAFRKMISARSGRSTSLR